MIPSRLSRDGALLLALLAWSPATLAAVVPYMGLEDLEREAEVVVLGSVEAADSGWSDDGRIIVTRVTVTVEEVLKGGPRKNLVIEVPGGTMGGQTLVASGAPMFRKGDRAVLFLQHGAPAMERGAAQALPLAVVGWNQGRFEMRRDPNTRRDIVRQPSGGTLYVDAQGRPAARDVQVSGPRELSDFLKEIEGLVARGRAAHGAGRP